MMAGYMALGRLGVGAARAGARVFPRAGRSGVFGLAGLFQAWGDWFRARGSVRRGSMHSYRRRFGGGRSQYRRPRGFRRF